MATERIKQLEKFYEEEPGDPFNLYALALEYRAIDLGKARAFFNMLLQEHPDYLPTYYHAAQFFQLSGDREKAIRLFEEGISLAHKTNDLKTLRELRSALEEMMYE